MHNIPIIPKEGGVILMFQNLFRDGILNQQGNLYVLPMITEAGIIVPHTGYRLATMNVTYVAILITNVHLHPNLLIACNQIAFSYPLVNLYMYICKHIVQFI